MYPLWHSPDLSDLISVTFNSRSDGRDRTGCIQSEVKSKLLPVPRSSVPSHLYWCLEATDISLINAATIQPLPPRFQQVATQLNPSVSFYKKVRSAVLQ